LDDVEEVMQHPFFKDIDRNKLLAEQIEPPFRPSKDTSGGITQFYDNYNSKQDLEETFLPEDVVKSVKKN